MNATTLKAVQRHGRQLLAIFPNATERDPVALCKKLRRIEAAAQWHAEMLCSDESYCNQPEHVHGQTEARIHARLNKILGTVYGERAEGEPPIHINLDPRGYALKIDDSYMRAHNVELHRDWGGYGIIAPDLTESN